VERFNEYYRKKLFDLLLNFNAPGQASNG